MLQGVIHSLKIIFSQWLTKVKITFNLKFFFKKKIQPNRGKKCFAKKPIGLKLLKPFRMEKPVNSKCSDPQQLVQLVCVHGSVSHAPTTPTGIIKPQKYSIYKQNRSLVFIYHYGTFLFKRYFKKMFFRTRVYSRILPQRGGSSTPANTFGINRDDFFF